MLLRHNNKESVMSDLENFRAEARAWLEANCPPEMRTPAKSEDDACWGGRNVVFQSEAQKLWLERCAAKGYTVPDWPKPYGGAGLSSQEAKVLRQEMASMGCRSPLSSFGPNFSVIHRIQIARLCSVPF